MMKIAKTRFAIRANLRTGRQRFIADAPGTLWDRSPTYVVATGDYVAAQADRQDIYENQATTKSARRMC